MYTYIVADDEIIVRKGTIAKLDALSDELVCAGEAGNGLQALDLLAEKRPDILITDMYMPEMNGLALLRTVSEKWPDVQIIVISGYKDFEYARQALSARAVDYLLKPFCREDIQRAAMRAMEKLEEKSGTFFAPEENRDLAESIQSYIRFNYAKDMPLNLIADHFGINPSYCSYLFHLRTGRRFVDYVNEVRVEEAKKLLLGTDKKITQIARAVGYSDGKYFFRVFKRIAGCTPEQYRSGAGG